MQMRSSITKIACSLIVFTSFCWGVAANAKDLGNSGNVYPIAERDAAQEIEARAKQVNWKKEMSKVKPENYRPEHMTSLPRASKNRVFNVDMTYTLEMDVPDGRGGVLYPKGYSFNPLDYISFPKTLVVIDGEDKEQVEWFRQSLYVGRPDVMFMLTAGSYVDLGKNLRRPVFYADSRIVEKFKLQAVPSVVKQAGRFMEVKEIDVKHPKKNTLNK
jgi:conjugal transfer pilus assembly protein TraW